MSKQLQNIGEQLLPVVAYGDAVGLPCEAKNAEQIKQRYGQIDQMHPTTDNELFAGLHGVGTWSDDTQLSAAVAEGLIEMDGFDINEQARQHIKAYRESEPSTFKSWWPRGWGGSTTFSVRRLIEGVSPYDSGESGADGKGAGNGVLMKMSPLVYWDYVRQADPKQSIQQVRDLTVMTHAAPEAIVSSQVHRAMLMQLLGVQVYEIQENPSLLNAFYRDAVFIARAFEVSEDQQYKTSHVLDQLSEKLVDGHPTGLHTDHILEAAPKSGFYAPETLLMAYGSFLIESHFPDSVYRAVELGGDTDSIASIVGTMSLFLYGNTDRPHDYNKLFDIDRLESVSKELADTALRIN